MGKHGKADQLLVTGLPSIGLLSRDILPLASFPFSSRFLSSEMFGVGMSLRTDKTVHGLGDVAESSDVLLPVGISCFSVMLSLH